MAAAGKYPGWWDWTSYAIENPEMMAEIRALTLNDLAGLSRDGFQVRLFQTRQDFYLAEALEYVRAWQRSTADNPVGICGPIGPTEQLPLVAEIINALDINVRHGIFAGMDEFIGADGKAIGIDSPLSFKRADLELCFDRIRPELRMPDTNLFFPTEDIPAYTAPWEDASFEWDTTQGGQGDTTHFAFNDPLKVAGDFSHVMPTAERFAQMRTRIVDLHPATIIQDARHSCAGEQWLIPQRAVTVGPHEVLGRSKRISIWHPGHHASGFGIRLTTFMIANRIADARVPMSLLARHDNVIFSLLAPKIEPAGFEMH
jgi:glucosamine-6-phosphate deaminase